MSLVILQEEGREGEDEMAEVKVEALHQAKQRGLFKKFIDEKVEQASGRTALMIAAEFGNEETASILITAGANVMLADPNNDTALHIASEKHSAPVCSALMVAGGEELIFAKNKSGNTCLHACLEKKESNPGTIVEDVVDLLCNAGGDMLMCAVNNFGNTPLHIACQNASFDVVQHLIKRGGASDAVGPRNFVDSTCIHYAVVRGDVALAEMVVKACGELLP